MAAIDVHDISALTRTGPIPVQPGTATGQSETQQARPEPSPAGGETRR